ncbi:probable uridine nucleosidase 2 [Dendronephthya gigantea]|uniref:probable uridine nucleosidase 2 n=1 Tax=Dendronephthya gigantea TaxID=151771 RepID=UPI00106CF7A3|nr:probable uridine nucleosidase 2 [Dendronephthya gigantea]
MANKVKVIIDTDCGVDDAQAILIMLSKEFSDRIDVVGITCCSGNVLVDQVVINVLKVLTAAERLDIPVCKGAYSPLLPVDFDASHYHGDDGLGDSKEVPEPDVTLLQGEHAVNYLVRMSQECCGEITLLTIGPQTNIALACRMDPNFGKNFKKLVIMGGNYQGKGNVTICSEFNFHFDPEAALVVLKEFTCPIIMVTWELCIGYEITHEFLAQCLDQGTTKSKFAKKITAMLHQLYLDRVRCLPTHVVQCDQFAASIIACPEIILEQENVYATVEVQGCYTRGQMVIDWRNKLKKRKNVFIVTEIDIEKYKLIYKKSLLQ